MNTWNNFEIETMQEGIQELVCLVCGHHFIADYIPGENIIDNGDDYDIPVCPACGAAG